MSYLQLDEDLAPVKFCLSFSLGILDPITSFSPYLMSTFGFWATWDQE